MSTNYKSANDKPDKLLTGFISVRVPELKQIYSSIQGTTSTSEIIKKFALPAPGGFNEDQVKECLRFMNAIDLIESPTGDILDTVEKINDRHLGDIPFEIRLLYHCNKQEGKQSHFSDIYYASLIEGDKVIVPDPDTPDSSRDELRAILKRETDYNFSWTDEKIDMWIAICEQIGLVTETDDGIVLSPCRALLHDALALAPVDSNDTPGYGNKTFEDGEAESILHWINENLFTVYEDNVGSRRVHPAISDVLRNMSEDEVISLSAPGDAQNEVTLPPKDLTEDKRGNRMKITNISVRSKPSEPAYEYPLNQLLTQQ
jgi:hypothetical protein